MQTESLSHERGGENMNKILQTKDYDQFKTIVGNRDIDIDHVNYLVKLNSKENLLHLFPGTVTKDGYLFDGQHRLEAAKANDWDFFYTVSEKTLAELGDTIVALTNTAQKRWAIKDYINYFVKHGKEQYIFLTQLMDTYKMSYTNVLSLTSGSSQTRSIRVGELKIFTSEEEKQIVIDMLDQYIFLKDFVPGDIFLHRAFVMAVRTVFNSMSAEDLKGEIIRSGIDFTRKANTTDYLRLLESIVNFKRQEKNHIRFF